MMRKNKAVKILRNTKKTALLIYAAAFILLIVAGVRVSGITKEAVRSVRILVPHIEKQNEFATFVCQIENSKCEMQNSLDEIYTTYQSIAQQFFG